MLRLVLAILLVTPAFGQPPASQIQSELKASYESKPEP
ncbi:hypothetical protein BH11PLA2_BH11PLA2_48590 [soil metagenome]